MKTNKIMILVVLAFMVFSVLSPSIAHANGMSGVFDDEYFNVHFDKDGMDVKGQDDQTSAWKTLLDKYKNFITGIAAVGAVTMVVLFIMQFIKLGTTVNNPSQRGQALAGVFWTGLAAAGLGAVALITGIFYNAI